MRLGDLGALKKYMCELCNQDYSDEPCEPSNCVFYNAVEQAPTIDPVHAAGGCYCRECKRFEGDEFMKYCGEYGGLVKPDDFCSRGQRKEADHEIS